MLNRSRQPNRHRRQIFFSQKKKSHWPTVDGEKRRQIGYIVLDMLMPLQNRGEKYDRPKQFDPCVKLALSSGYTAF
jgi:hypothetical protein